MATKTLDIQGGKKLTDYLNALSAKMRAGSVNVGFLSGIRYPADATKPSETPPYVAQVAFYNEFGTKHSPPRPFFRSMIAAKSPEWGPATAQAAKASDYDTAKTLELVGTGIKDQLVTSIVNFTSPPLAQSTIDRKGFDKPLIDTGVMQRSVDFEVKTE